MDFDASDIQKEYDRLGYTMGWRFMSCPEDLVKQAKLALVFLNPGGNHDDGLPKWHQPDGNSYWVESWRDRRVGKSVLQTRVQSFCRAFGYGPDDIFSANFVPFRSPNWAALPKKQEAIIFAKALWGSVLGELHAQVIVCVGKTEVGKNLVTLTEATLKEVVPMGWGDQKYEIFEDPNGRLLLSIPHLSRFSADGDFQRTKILKDLVSRLIP